MSNAEDVPFEIRRADFFALAWAVLGVFSVTMVTASLVDDGSFDVSNALNALLAFCGSR